MIPGHCLNSTSLNSASSVTDSTLGMLQSLAAQGCSGSDASKVLQQVAVYASTEQLTGCIELALQLCLQLLQVGRRLSARRPSMSSCNCWSTADTVQNHPEAPAASLEPVMDLLKQQLQVTAAAQVCPHSR